MKRMQVMLPDHIYQLLVVEAERRGATVDEIVRRAIDHLLDSPTNGSLRPPVLTLRDLGIPLIPAEQWREMANQRQAC